MKFPDRAYFDRAYARRRNLGGELDRFVQILGIDQIETGELLLGLGKRAVGDRQLTVAHAHRGRGLNRLQRLGGDDAGFKVGAGEHDVNPTSAQLLTRSDLTYSDNDNDGHFLTENQQTDNEDKGGPFYYDRQVLGVLNGSAWEWANRDKYASIPERISFVVANNGFVWNGGPTMSHTRMTGTVSEMFTTSSFTVCRYACANTPGCSGVSLSDTTACLVRL